MPIEVFSFAFFDALRVLFSERIHNISSPRLELYFC